MMKDDTLVHPNVARLIAFGRATLDDDATAEVERHLAVCESCCQMLATVPGDEFAHSLRTARNSSLLSTDRGADGSLAETRPVTCAGTGFDIPSSFVLTGSDPESTTKSTMANSGPSAAELPEVPLEQELPPEVLNHSRYGIVRKLGVGGMGSVYLAQHRVMDRPVALKVIRPDLLDNATLIERFHREVKSAARLATHPNIVAAYDAEQAGDSHFLVMEFVDGVDLAHLVKRYGPLSVEDACRAIKQAAEGLEHAHQRGMVHRDIKPQNLMRTPDGQVKILDFGLARFASESLPDLVPAFGSGTQSTASDHGGRITLTDMLLGTADYIAPEQASEPRWADIRADIYSLGCTLYYLLAGHPPFPDGNLAQKVASHAELKPKPLTEVRADVPARLAVIVERMMAKNRNARFQRPAGVAEALATFADPSAAKKRTSVDRESIEEGSRTAGSQPLVADSRSGSPPWPTASSFYRPRRRLVKVAAGLSVLVMTGYGFMSWYVRTTKLLDRTAAVPLTLPAPKLSVSAPAVQPNSATVEKRTIAPAASQVGYMVVAVRKVCLVPINEPLRADGLCVTLAVKNVSKKPMPFLSWSGRDIGVMLRIEKGSRGPGAFMTFYDQLPVPKQEAKSINPNETITDIVMFEPTPADKDLDLDLPVPGTDESFLFSIPHAMVEISAPSQKINRRVPGQATAAPKVQAKEKAVDGPDDPEQDGKLCAEVTREYEKSARDIKSRSMGISSNDAVRYRRNAGNELLKQLAKKYGLRLDQVRRILGLD
jgi:serine/threonine protein kinase